MSSAGDLTLDGVAIISFAEGFSPALGRSIPLMGTSGGTRHGEFAAVLHPLQRQCTIDVGYGDASVLFGLETVVPVAICRDITVTLDATGHATISADDIDNGSSDNCVIASREISRSDFTCNDVGTHSVTLTIKDSAGNVSTCDALVTVQSDGRYTGAAGGSWFTAESWCGGVPTEVSDVSIRTKVIVDSMGAVARSVTIEDGGELVVGAASGASLDVVETLAVHSGGTLTIGLRGRVSADAVIVEAGSTLNVLDSTARVLVRDLTLMPGSTLNWLAGTFEVSGTLMSADVFDIGCFEMGATLRLLDGWIDAPSLRVCADGTLTGNGTVACTVTNDGRVRPGASPGVIDIEGDFVQSSTGALSIEIGGLEPGVGYGQLVVSGTALLDGVLDAQIIGGFVPAWPDAFDVLAAGGATGAFATTIMPPLAMPYFLAVDMDPNGVALVVRRLGDINNDGVVNGFDLSLLLGQWGPCSAGEACIADLNHDGIVDGADAAIVLGNWAP